MAAPAPLNTLDRIYQKRPKKEKVSENIKIPAALKSFTISVNKNPNVFKLTLIRELRGFSVRLFAEVRVKLFVDTVADALRGTVTHDHSK